MDIDKEGTVVKMERRGQLRAKIVGRAWRIKRADLDAYVKRL